MEAEPAFAFPVTSHGRQKWWVGSDLHWHSRRRHFYRVRGSLMPSLPKKKLWARGFGLWP